MLRVKCPKCRSDMVERKGRYGGFWGCSRFPRCKGTRSVRDAEASINIGVRWDEFCAWAEAQKDGGQNPVKSPDEDPRQEAIHVKNLAFHDLSRYQAYLSKVHKGHPLDQEALDDLALLKDAYREAIRAWESVSHVGSDDVGPFPLI